MDVNACKALPQILDAHLQMHFPCVIGPIIRSKIDSAPPPCADSCTKGADEQEFQFYYSIMLMQYTTCFAL